MKHFGDITKLDGHQLPPVDIITGGSPCQDLSVAGKREGLAGERSGLFMEQIRVIKEMRENDRRTGRTGDLVRPRYMVWENVPGAFSSNGGEDFRAVLEETARVADETAVIPRLAGKQKWTPSGAIVGDGWSIAWRVHDAQFWGVPQRRKRISLVADFGGFTAPKILFESESLSGDSKSSAEEREETAGAVGNGIEDTGCGVDLYNQTLTGNVAATLSAFSCETATRNGPSVLSATIDDTTAYTLKIRGGVDVDSHGKKAGKGALVQTELSGTLGVSQDQTLISFGSTAYSIDKAITTGATGYSAGYCVHREYPPPLTVDRPHAVAYGISPYASNAMLSDNPNSGIYKADTSRTLDLNGGSPACNQGGIAVVQAFGFDGYNQTIGEEYAQPLRSADGGDTTPKVVCLEGNGSRPSHRGDGYAEEDVSYTLNSVERHSVCYRKQAHPQNSEQGQGWEKTDVNDTLNSFDNTESRTPTVIVGGAENTAIAIENHPNDSRCKLSEDGMVQTLSGRMGTGGNNTPMVLENRKRPTSYQETTGTLSPGGHPGSYNGQDAYNDMLVTAVDFRNGTEDHNVNASLQSSSYHNINSNNVCRSGSIVRRLTPLECERLQGYPDDFTNIGDWVDSKGKIHKGDADSPRYKALGNSIALPFWQWMANRMVKYLSDSPTMASLFDGIGGFPLVFSRCGCTPVWASEIEEFPIAVTKLRFPEKDDD